MAEALGRAAPRYALVAASPLPRAKETARLIGGRIDAVEPGLLPDLARVIQLARIEDYGGLLGEAHEGALAAEQAATWARLAQAAGGPALAVTHGGVVELGALAVARALGVRLAGPAFSYCEGVRVRYERGRPAAIALLRA